MYRMSLSCCSIRGRIDNQASAQLLQWGEDLAYLSFTRTNPTIKSCNPIKNTVKTLNSNTTQDAGMEKRRSFLDSILFAWQTSLLSSINQFDGNTSVPWQLASTLMETRQIMGSSGTRGMHLIPVGPVTSSSIGMTFFFYLLLLFIFFVGEVEPSL